MLSPSDKIILFKALKRGIFLVSFPNLLLYSLIAILYSPILVLYESIEDCVNTLLYPSIVLQILAFSLLKEDVLVIMSRA